MMHAMKKNRGIICMLLCAVLLCTVPVTLGESSSWSQINQSLTRSEDWQRIVKNPTDFQLGESTLLEGSDNLWIGRWGDYPSIDGSTVCAAGHGTGQAVAESAGGGSERLC